MYGIFAPSSWFFMVDAGKYAKKTLSFFMGPLAQVKLTSLALASKISKALIRLLRDKN